MRAPRYGHPDAVQGAIVDALRKVGASVAITTGVGDGFPDLVVGFRQATDLFEVKAEDGALRESQERFARSWRGRPVRVVRTPEDALRAVGAIR